MTASLEASAPAAPWIKLRRSGMDIGLGVYANPPPAAVVEAGKLAGELGYSTSWTTDSRLPWREIYEIARAMLLAQGIASGADVIRQLAPKLIIEPLG